MDLKDFINQSKARLNNVLARLQWTEENILKKFNTNAANSNAAGEQEDFPESCASNNTVKLTQNELKTLLNNDKAEIPQNFSELQLNFTREEKLNIYEHIVERTGKCTEVEHILPNLNDGKLSFAEIVAKEKLAKKKRRKYRTSRPTHIEEVRGLVELQMQALSEYNQQKYMEDEALGRKQRLSKHSHASETESKRSQQPDKQYNREDDKHMNKATKHYQTIHHASRHQRASNSDEKRAVSNNKHIVRDRTFESYNHRRSHSRHRSRSHHRSRSRRRSRSRHSRHRSSSRYRNPSPHKPLHHSRSPPHTSRSSHIPLSHKRSKHKSSDRPRSRDKTHKKKRHKHRRRSSSSGQ